MLGLFQQMSQHLEGQVLKAQPAALLKDQNVIFHVSGILGNADKIKNVSDIGHISNIIKQTSPPPFIPKITKTELPIPLIDASSGNSECLMHEIQSQMEKLKWAGFSLLKEEIYLIEEHLRTVAKKEKALEVRFLGKILGSQKDYYVIQGLVPPKNEIEEYSKGAEKRGEGVNYFTFWVSTNILGKEWSELPLIEPEHVKTARKIRVMFTGQLGQPILSYPAFKGEERHYV